MRPPLRTLIKTGRRRRRRRGIKIFIRVIGVHWVFRRVRVNSRKTLFIGRRWKKPGLIFLTQSSLIFPVVFSVIFVKFLLFMTRVILWLVIPFRRVPKTLNRPLMGPVVPFGIFRFRRFSLFLIIMKPRFMVTSGPGISRNTVLLFLTRR